MSQSTVRALLNLLARLKEARIYYRLSDHTEDAIMVEAVVPGERWEIELHDDGQVGVEVFASTGEIHDQAYLEGLITKFSD
jgi:hypothetical protein